MESGGLGSFSLRDGNWENFKVRLEQYLLVNDDKYASDVKKRAIFLNALQDDCFSLLVNLCIPKKVTDVKLEDLISKLNEYCSMTKCFFEERSQFYTAKQRSDETIRDFAVRLKALSVNCKFGNNLAEKLRDFFVLGCKPGKVREKLFLESESYTFEKCVQVAECIELVASTQAQGREFNTVLANNSVGSGRVSPSSYEKKRVSNRFNRMSSQNKSRSPSPKRKCFVCGNDNHISSDCKFKGYTCRICSKKGHLAKQCKSFSVRKNVNTLFSDTSVDNINSVEPYWVEVSVDGIRNKFMLDSGASCSVIGKDCYFNQCNSNKLVHENISLRGFDNTLIKVIGAFTPLVEYNGQCRRLKIIVVGSTTLSILGRDFMELFNLGITGIVNCVNRNTLKERLVKKFPEVFTDKLGKFNKYEVNLRLKDTAVPVFRNNRIIPFVLKEKVERELNTLISDGIIEPVHYSEFASPIVPVIKKNGSIRLCGDYKSTVNNQLLIDKYPLPRIEELLTKVNGGKVFAKIDLKSAYNQFVLKKECRRFTTINTHLGLFQYKRLVYGLASAPAIFAKAMASCLSGLQKMTFYLDDIIVIGEDEEDLEKNVCDVLERLKSCNLTVNSEKCEFNLKVIEFLGYKISEQGIQPCERNKEAILNAPSPSDLNHLRSLLGMISYYRNFIPNMADVLSPMYELLKKDVNFQWGTEQENSFAIIKKILTSDRILTHFDENIPVKLVTDGSLNGVGATLIHVFQNGFERPIGFASRTLSKAEKNYSILDIEATAIIFGIKKFYQYLYGREFTLAVDNQPLVRIFGQNREIPKIAASRLQRYAVMLGSFNFKIEYVKSKNNCSDFLSRCPIEKGSCEDKIESGYINYFENNGFNLSLDVIKSETEKDDMLSQVKKFLIEGWPASVKKVQNSNFNRMFWEKRLELSLINGCILYQHRVVVPESLRQEVLKMLHRSHLGVFKTKGIAKSFVWWPKINQDLEKITENCKDCLEIKPESQKSSLAVWPYEPEVWFRVHIDHGSLHNKNFLVVVDASSKWIECLEVNSLSSKENIEVLHRLFSQFGFPATLVSDNGTCFCSEDFEIFCKKNGMVHITSPVNHPSSNGQAESAVKICKNFLKKICKRNRFPSDYKEKLGNFLTDYRNTVHATTGCEPSLLLMGRKIRTVFDSLIPRKVEERTSNSGSSRKNKVIQKVIQNQGNQKRQYRGRTKTGFDVGQKVMTRDFRSQGSRLWVPGVVVEKKGNKVYFVKINNSNMVWKRHLDQIRKLHVSWREEDGPEFIASDTRELSTDEWDLSGMLRSRSDSNSVSPCFRSKPWHGRLRPR